MLVGSCIVDFKFGKGGCILALADCTQVMPCSVNVSYWLLGSMKCWWAGPHFEQPSKLRLNFSSSFVIYWCENTISFGCWNVVPPLIFAEFISSWDITTCSNVCIFGSLVVCIVLHNSLIDCCVGWIFWWCHNWLPALWLISWWSALVTKLLAVCTTSWLWCG